MLCVLRDHHQRSMWPNRATADELLKEYKACESPDYISYVSSQFQSSPSLCWCNVHHQGSNDGEQAG